MKSRVPYMSPIGHNLYSLNELWRGQFKGTLFSACPLGPLGSVGDTLLPPLRGEVSPTPRTCPAHSIEITTRVDSKEGHDERIQHGCLRSQRAGQHRN